MGIEALTAIAALVGGVTGAVAGQVASHALAARRRRGHDHDQAVAGHLWQLQDAMECLAHRVENLRCNDHNSLVQDNYYRETTLFAVARFLSEKRRLGASGAYARVWDRGAGDELRQQLENVERWLSRPSGQDADSTFHRYHREALASLAAVETETGASRTPVQEFRGALRQLSDKELDEALTDFLARMSDEGLAKLGSVLDEAGARLSKITKLEWRPVRRSPRVDAEVSDDR